MNKGENDVLSFLIVFFEENVMNYMEAKLHILLTWFFSWCGLFHPLKESY